jgi:hypothetical protein
LLSLTALLRMLWCYKGEFVSAIGRSPVFLNVAVSKLVLLPSSGERQRSVRFTH